MRYILFFLISFISSLYSGSKFEIFPFGENGKFKMLYDRRQGPQSLLVNDTIHLVYNGQTKVSHDIKKDSAYPLKTSFNLKQKKFNVSHKIGKSDNDHHFSPIIWMDQDGFIHTLHGCHKTKGTHLFFKQPDSLDKIKLSALADSVSYPNVYHISGQRQLLYFRNGGHRGSWGYITSSDQSKLGEKGIKTVTDLNMGDDLINKPLEEMDELSSYHSTKLSPDGRTLHVVFSHYDDNKSNLKEKFYNPRYKTDYNLGLKFNLYYVKINLETHLVSNYSGEKLKTPIDFNTAQKKCKILDTDYRGAGIPAQIVLNKQGNPSFFHILSGELLNDHDYYYIHHTDGDWQVNKITQSNHEWNSGYMYQKDTKLIAFLFTRDSKISRSFMDKHGGGDLEKWISMDHGITWKKAQDIHIENYDTNWRFNNIKPVVDHNGKAVDGKYIFYGWNKDQSTAKSFLMIENNF